MKIIAFILSLFLSRKPVKPQARVWTREEHEAHMKECVEVYRRGTCSMKTGHTIGCRCEKCERIYGMLVELDS